MSATTYTTIEGTSPTEGAPHEPRKITAAVNSQITQMMSEIGDGQFVAWGYCGQCSNHVSICRCTNGPVEPHFISKWRDERFDTSMNARLNAEPAPDRPMRLSHPIAARPLEAPVDNALDKALAAVAAAKSESENDNA